MEMTIRVPKISIVPMGKDAQAPDTVNTLWAKTVGLANTGSVNG